MPDETLKSTHHVIASVAELIRTNSSDSLHLLFAEHLEAVASAVRQLALEFSKEVESGAASGAVRACLSGVQILPLPVDPCMTPNYPFRLVADGHGIGPILSSVEEGKRWASKNLKHNCITDTTVVIKHCDGRVFAEAVVRRDVRRIEWITKIAELKKLTGSPLL